MQAKAKTGSVALSRQDFLRAALVLAASPLLRYVPAEAAEAVDVREVATGIFVHHGRYEMQSPENRGDMANASFIIGDEAVAVIDTLGSAGGARSQKRHSRRDEQAHQICNQHAYAS